MAGDNGGQEDAWFKIDTTLQEHSKMLSELTALSDNRHQHVVDSINDVLTSIDELKRMIKALTTKKSELFQEAGAEKSLTPTMAIEKKSPDYGKSQYGCEHYRRRCKIRAPCCDKVFTCRHCHNEATSSLKDPNAQHRIKRGDVKQVICAICDTEQEVAQVCMNCGVNMGEYFCRVCKFYDDEIEKQQFHCETCGICRVGGRENFTHCPKCGCCYLTSGPGDHKCLKNSMKTNKCSVCFEDLFDSIKPVQLLNCGHPIHLSCFKQLVYANEYRCPSCRKTVLDMTKCWKEIDEAIVAAPMSAAAWKMVDIVCTDCNAKGRVEYHVIGNKCRECNSYNTIKLS